MNDERTLPQISEATVVSLRVEQRAVNAMLNTRPRDGKNPHDDTNLADTKRVKMVQT